MASSMSWFSSGRSIVDEDAATAAEAAAAEFPLPTDLSRMTDAAKWQHSKERWDRQVDPASDKFRLVYYLFVEKLKTESPDAVVRAHFCKHEVRKFLNGFVDKRRLGALHKQQRADKAAFRQLREGAGARFAAENMPADMQNPSPLPLKLTMMYFGFPVEPMTFTDPLQTDGTSLFANLNSSSLFDDDDDDADEDFDDEDLSFVPEELRPLRFLNYYDRRGYGKDNSHMNPEKTYELFYGIPMVVPTKELMTRMGLRGAGLDEDASDDETSDAGETNGDATTSVDRVSPHITRNASAGEQVYLWGLSGRTTFSYFDAKSFFSAIDRLLGLSKRGDEATSVGVTISLLSHPKGQRGPCTVLASDQCFLGQSAEDELNFYKTWLETVQYFDDQIEDGQALDMCVAQLSQDIHFSESQKSLAYQPSLADDQVVSFAVSGEEDDTLAYLSMAEGVNGETASSQYQAWFQSLWRTLSRPTEEQLKTYSVGSKHVVAPQPCLMNICARNGEGDTDSEHWFLSDVGPTPEAWKWFIEAYQTNGHREFVLDAIATTDPRASSIRVPTGTEWTTDCSHSAKSVPGKTNGPFYWGCHNHTEDAIAFMTSNGPAPFRPTLGRPGKGVQVDDFAKGKAFREWSYAHPLSINMQGQHPSFPINAPPLEQLLKTPGPNGKLSDSLPVMSTAVMTPSEQRRLQETVFEMRSFALNRAQPCPFKPCRSYFSIDDQGREQFQKHIQEQHIDKKCPLCNDRSFGYWDEQQKRTHFFEEHNNYWSKKDDHLFNSIFTVESFGWTDAREQAWNFCARCGRDHNKLNVPGDRTHHDNRCFPGVPATRTYDTFCVQCGQNNNNKAGHRKCEKRTVADHNGEPTTVVHCPKCALGTHLLSRAYAAKHHARCRGVHSDRAHYCPWCGVDVAMLPRAEGWAHLDECRFKPAGAEGPIDSARGVARDSPRDNVRTRGQLRRDLLTNNGETKNIMDVPKVCVFDGCPEQLYRLNAIALLVHFAWDHGSGSDNLRVCPLCELDFSKREWLLENDKLDHFQDHIDRRDKRITLDLAIAQKPNKLDKDVIELIRRRNLDEFTEFSVEGKLVSQVSNIASDITATNDKVDQLDDRIANLSHVMGQLEGSIASVVKYQSSYDNIGRMATGQFTGAVQQCLVRLESIESSIAAAQQASEKRKRSEEHYSHGDKRMKSLEDINTGAAKTILTPSLASHSNSSSRDPADDTGPTAPSAKSSPPLPAPRSPSVTSSVSGGLATPPDSSLPQVSSTGGIRTSVSPSRPKTGSFLPGRGGFRAAGIGGRLGKSRAVGRTVVKNLPTAGDRVARIRVARVQRPRLLEFEPAEEYDDFGVEDYDDFAVEGGELYSDEEYEW